MAWTDVFGKIGGALKNIDWSQVGSSAASLGSGAVSLISSRGSAHKAFKYNSALQKQAFDYQMQSQQKQYDLTRSLNQNAYQDTTQSMRAAGINPMLAISQGINGMSAGTGSSPGSGSVSVDNPDIVGSALAYKQVKSQTSLNKTQEDVNKTQEKVNTYAADAAHEQAAKTNEETRQLMEYGPLKAKAEIESINANTAKVLQDTKNSIALTNSQIGVNDASAKSLNSNSKYLNKRTTTTAKDRRYGISIPKIGPLDVHWNEY